MEIHKLQYKLTSRSVNQVETTVEQDELEFQTFEPQLFTRQIKASDNLVDVAIPPIVLNYGMVMAHYTADDAPNGIKAGDPAPVTVRLNGGTQDFTYNKGFALLPSNIVSLKVATSYDINKIEVQVRLG